VKDTIITIILVIVLAMIMLFSDFSGSKVIVYDCQMIERGIDYPRPVIEECRRLKMEEQRDRNTI
jgi:hypothetical protein